MKLHHVECEMGYGYYLNDPRFWRGVIDVLHASWEATEKRFAKYNKPNKDIMEEKKTINEWKEAFADLYKEMRKELGASDLDVKIYQNEVKPIVNFDIHF